MNVEGETIPSQVRLHYSECVAVLNSTSSHQAPTDSDVPAYGNGSHLRLNIYAKAYIFLSVNNYNGLLSNLNTPFFE